MNLQRYDTADCSTEHNVYKCDDGDFVKYDDAKAAIEKERALTVYAIEKRDAALAEKDAIIKELEATVEKLRNCWNCNKSEERCLYFEGPVCERWEIEKC